MFSNKSFKFVILIILLTFFTIFSGCGGGNPVTPPIDNDDDSDSEEIELIEVVSKEINLEEGGVIEVTDPESELYGLKLIIEPQKNIEKNKDTPVTITIYTALLATCILPEHQGYLITPFIIMSDFADLCGSLIILYTDSQLINSGVGKDESVKVCRVRYPLHRSWEEISPLIVSKNIVYVSIGLGDILYYYTLTVENAKPPDSSAFKNPKPGDLLYKFSKFPPLLNINEGWLPGHVGIYVGEKYNEEDGKYNVIEALLFGGVQRNYYNPISKFSGSATYMGARQPKSGPLTSGQRDIIVDWAEAMADLDLPYAWIQTFTSMFYSGLGRGNLVKGTDIFGSFNCVGLAEKAYEIVGVDLVSNFDEGNEDDSPFSILTPAEQWYKTVPIPENLAPIISELTAISSSIDINQATNITCSASDPDDDSLAYTWTKTGGTISGSGSTITWTAPSTAETYTITCTVFDGNGGEDSESVNIQVFELEEIELIGKWGFGGDYIVRRWPDGHVDVYDETNYTRIQDVIQEWNAAIGGTVIFHLSNDSNSPVKVKFDPDISQDLAGQYFVYCSDDNYEFYRADVNIQKNYLDSLDLDTKYCLYLWLFSGVAGFNIQADVDPNPYREWWNFSMIPDDIKTMLRGLYKVPCGYNLLDKKLKENWSRPIVKNLQNIYEGGLYKLCK